MTVREFTELLQQMPQDATLIEDRYSDWALVETGPFVVEGIPQLYDEWIQRVDPKHKDTMDLISRARIKTYVHL